MKIYQEKDYDALSRRAANLISAEVIRKPDCVLGLATGSTPVGTYRQLSAWNQKGDFSFKDVRTVNLDEYLGLPPTHDQSYRYFMQENLFDKIDIPFEHTHVRTEWLLILSKSADDMMSLSDHSGMRICSF